VYTVCHNSKEHYQNLRSRGDVKFCGMYNKFIIAHVAESKEHMYP